MRYIIHYDIAAIVMLLFILFLILTRKGMNKVSNWVFSFVVLAELLCAVTDIISSYYISFPDRITSWGRDFWCYFYLGVHNVVPMLLVCYVICLTGIQKRVRWYKWFGAVLPSLLSLGFLATNMMHRGVFYFDESNVYCHGPLMAGMYANAGISLLIATYILMRYRKTLSKYKILAAIVCEILCVFPIVVQFFFPYLLIELFFQAIGLMGLVFSVENEDERTNPISGAYNRFAFMRDVDGSIHAKNRLSVLTVKIYNNSYYNSTFGVSFMNQTLRDMATWLRTLHKSAVCYDFYGGHFALVVNTPDREVAKELAEQIRERFDLEWSKEPVSIVLPAEISVLHVPEEVSTVDRIMLFVDAPTEEAGGRSQLMGSDQIHYYQRSLLIEQKLSEALENNSLEVYYQPIWDRASRKVRSAEALVRLVDREIGVIMPEEFIPIAERNGSIMDVGAQVMEKVCAFYSENRLELHGIDHIAVNLSVLQCMNRYLPQMIQDILHAHNMLPQHINLEITESAAAGNKSAMEKTVRELAGSGYTLALDDYGTGYSNYSYMFAMPFKIIKIDKSILWSALDTQNVRGQESSLVLLENTVRMLRQMQYRVVVEGVETKEQMVMLSGFGADYMQGFFFAEALPGPQFLHFADRFNSGDTVLFQPREERRAAEPPQPQVAAATRNIVSF